VEDAGKQVELDEFLSAVVLRVGEGFVVLAGVPEVVTSAEVVGLAAVPDGEAPAEVVGLAAVPDGEAPAEVVGLAAVPDGEASAEVVGLATVADGVPLEGVDVAPELLGVADP